MSLPNRTEVAATIVEFLRKETNFNDPALINESTRLLETGVVDSLILMSLVAHCEDVYGCHIQPDDLTEDSVGSALNLADLVLRIQSAPILSMGTQRING
jgi:acyl carrier protein